MLPSPARSQRSAWYAVASVAVGLWIVGVTTVMTVVSWFVAEVASEQESSVPTWYAPTTAIFAGLLGVAPALALWRTAHRHAATQPGAVAAGRLWTVLGVVAVPFGCARAVPLAQNELLLATIAAVAAIAALVVHRWRRPAGPGPFHGRLAWASAAAVVLLLPWLWLAALGGLVETLAALAAAAAVGWLVANVLDAEFFAAFGRSRPWQVLVGGLVIGVALAPIAAVLGGPGVNVAEFVTVPAAGFVVAALSTPAGGVRRLSVELVVAGAVAGPLAFVDPEETSLILGLSDVGAWTAIAAGVGVIVALILGTACGFLLGPGRQPQRWTSAFVVILALTAGGVVYAVAGHPGFYGERLFVVMSQQADLSGLDTITDRSKRLNATYARLVQTANRTQASLRAQLDRLHIGYTPYYLVNGLLVDAGPALRPYVETLSGVDRVLIDQRLRPLPAPAAAEQGSAAPHVSPQWNIAAIKAEDVWAKLDVTGKGIVIGTSDSGVDGSHPALAGGYRGGDDSWYDPWSGTRVPTDHNGHGTHTLGTAVGRDGIGVAPGAQWVGCVNLDRNLGSPSHYLDCLQFMLAPFPFGGDPLRDGRPDRAPHVLTNSWGCPTVEGCDLDALRPATAALAAAGIFVVVAAGNSGPGCGSVADPPAPYRDVLTVGATDKSGAVASFSSRGPTPDGVTKPDIVAPGVDVVSALPGGTYGTLSGTSMATPHVAGTVALMWSANPKLIGDIATTTRILRETSTPVAPSDTGGCARTEDVVGAGLVNADGAVRAALALR